MHWDSDHAQAPTYLLVPQHLIHHVAMLLLGIERIVSLLVRALDVLPIPPPLRLNGLQHRALGVQQQLGADGNRIDGKTLFEQGAVTGTAHLSRCANDARVGQLYSPEQPCPTNLSRRAVVLHTAHIFHEVALGGEVPEPDTRVQWMAASTVVQQVHHVGVVVLLRVAVVLTRKTASSPVSDHPTSSGIAHYHGNGSSDRCAATEEARWPSP